LAFYLFNSQNNIKHLQPSKEANTRRHLHSTNFLSNILCVFNTGEMIEPNMFHDDSKYDLTQCVVNAEQMLDDYTKTHVLTTPNPCLKDLLMVASQSLFKSYIHKLGHLHAENNWSAELQANV